MDKEKYRGFKDLKVYQLAFNMALEIFKESESFPKEEKYALTDQIRRSSRAVASNIAEAWEKRKYPKSFVSKLVDAASEKSGTIVWLDFAKNHHYLSDERHRYFESAYLEIGRMLNSMINNPEKFCHS